MFYKSVLTLLKKPFYSTEAKKSVPLVSWGEHRTEKYCPIMFYREYRLYVSMIVFDRFYLY